ncbi:hypothetical protein ACSNOI_44570, partial [Actinomadura kijaniata]|uniref:hypothetical protein n=1 Tax=Actinomadura kijaniata TaxID=46161 RepID=UPI003F1DBDE1
MVTEAATGGAARAAGIRVLALPPGAFAGRVTAETGADPGVLIQHVAAGVLDAAIGWRLRGPGVVHTLWSPGAAGRTGCRGAVHALW